MTTGRDMLEVLLACGLVAVGGWSLISAIRFRPAGAKGQAVRLIGIAQVCALLLVGAGAVVSAAPRPLRLGVLTMAIALSVLRLIHQRQSTVPSPKEIR